MKRRQQLLCLVNNIVTIELRHVVLLMQWSMQKTIFKKNTTDYEKAADYEETTDYEQAADYEQAGDYKQAAD